MTPLGMLPIAALVLVVLAVLAYWMRFQLRLRWHSGIDRESFIGHFACLGVAPDIAGAVYDHYRGVAVWRSFRLSPDDDLQGVFGHTPEEMDSSLDAILSKLSLTLPPPSILREHDRKLTKIADVVNFVAWVGNHQGVEP
jgi:ferredoxin